MVLGPSANLACARVTLSIIFAFPSRHSLAFTRETVALFHGSDSQPRRLLMARRSLPTRLPIGISIVLLLAACGNAGGSVSSSTTASASAGSSAALPAEINIAWGPDPNPTMILENRGYLEGLLPDVTIKWTQFDNVSDAIPLLVAGNFDFVANFSTALFTNSIMGGAEMQSFLLTGVDQTIHLVAKPESGIGDCSDLAGKKVGVPFGGLAQYLLFGCLAGAGVDPADVNISDIPSADLLAAWERGDIEAALIWAPPSLALQDAGGAFVVDVPDIAAMGYGFTNQWSVRSAFAEQYPAAVKALVEAAQRTFADYQADPDAISREVAQVNVPAATDSDYQFFADAMAATHFPTCEEVLSPSWFGTADEPGGFMEILQHSAEFLRDQNIAPNVDMSKLDTAVYRDGCEQILADTGATPAPSAPNK